MDNSYSSFNGRGEGLGDGDGLGDGEGLAAATTGEGLGEGWAGSPASPTHPPSKTKPTKTRDKAIKDFFNADTPLVTYETRALQIFNRFLADQAPANSARNASTPPAASCLTYPYIESTTIPSKGLAK